MKRIIAIVAAVIYLSSCSSTSNKLITPLPAGYDTAALDNCTVPACFNVNDFNWMGGNLRMSVFGEDIYDAAEVSRMAVGDTLVYAGEKIVVENIEGDSGYLTINGGLDEGGAWLMAADGGTYRAVQFDDHSLYTDLGEAVVVLSDNFRILDCGADPLEPYDTVATDQKLYLESLADWRQSFSYLDTRVTIENGVITEIKRNWIP